MIKISKLLINTLIIRFFIMPHTSGCMQVLLNPWGILGKELFFHEISVLQPPNAIKMKFLANSFSHFMLFSLY